jgi:dipeptidyl aminopeptidase/acylaminoacyl peptidase
MATGKELRRLPTSAGEVSHDAAFAPDGKTLAVGCRLGVQLWDLTTGSLVRQIPEVDAVSVRFSPDGSLLAASGRDEAIHLWDWRTGKERHRLQAATVTLAFSPDGRTLASGNRDGLISLWDVASGKEVGQLPGHANAVHALAFSPDGRRLASGGFDSVVRVWEIWSSKEVLHFAGHAGPVTAVSFSPDGWNLVSGSEDTTLLVWDVTGRLDGGRHRPADLTTEDLKKLWIDLAGTEGPEAHRAVWSLAAAPVQAVPFLEARVRSFLGTDARQIERLIADLDADDFLVRQRASADLEKLADVAGVALHRAQDETSSPEVRRRIARILCQRKAEIIAWPQERLRRLRTVEVLEKIGTPEARQLLGSLVQQGPDAELVGEAQAALARLGKK